MPVQHPLKLEGSGFVNIFRKFFGSKTSVFGGDGASLRDAATGYDPYDKMLTDELRALLEPGESAALRYPVFPNGFRTAYTGEMLLRFYGDQINRLRNGAGLNRADFERLIMPVLLKFADYAQVLPASQSHHHRLACGLLAHSLDVACRAVLTAQITAFDTGVDPSRRTLRRERWYVASIFAALLHDAGKPQTDFQIHDEKQEKFWPASISISEWGAQSDVEFFFITWVKDRGEKHKVVSSSLVERFIPTEVRDWLREGGQDLYLAMIEAIAYSDPKATLTGIVIKADSNSVEIDLKTNNYDGVNVGALSVNVPSAFSRAARYLVENGTWTANMPGARIWATTQGVFLAWAGAVTEINGYMAEFKIPGLPRGPDSLGNALVDYGVLERAADGDIYWFVTPDVLANPGTGKSIKLKCVKVANPQVLYLYGVEPQPVAVEIGEGANAVRYDPEGGGLGISLAPNPTSGGAVDINAPAGAVSPMFSLDPVAPTAQPQDLAVAISPADEASLVEPLQQATSSISIGVPHIATAEQVSTPSKPQNQPGKGKGGKALSSPGISIDAGAPVASSPALVIGGAPAAPTPGDLAVEQLKARLNNQNKSAGKGKQPQQQKQGKQQESKDAQVNAVAAPAPAALAQPVPAPAAPAQSPYGQGADPFATLSGISLVDIDDAPKAVQLPVQDEWEDPFADDAPVQQPQVKPQVAAQAPVVTAESSAPVTLVEPSDSDSPDAIDDDQDDFDLPGDLGGIAATVVQPAVRPMFESLEEKSPKLSPGAILVEGEDDLGLGDFDADIMSLTGMPQPTYVARQESRAAQPRREANESSAPAFVIPDEFRFNDDPGVAISGVRDIPSDSPSGFAPAPADIEIRVREMSSMPSMSALIEVPLSELVQPGAPAVEFGDFDMPEFNVGIVMGAPSAIQVEAAPAQAPKEPSVKKDPLPEPAKPQRQPKAKPIAKALKNLSAPGLQLGSSTLMGAEAPASAPPAIKMSAAPISSGAQINIGRDIHGNGPKPKKKAGAEAQYAVVVSEHSGMKDSFTDEEAAEIEAYLSRTPELYEKLKFYAADVLKRTNVVHFKTFLPFHQRGFGADDLDALSRAMWIWTDFTNDVLAPSQSKRTTGITLSTYLSECLCCITGGVYNLAKNFPVTKIDYKTQAELASLVVDSCPNFEDLESGVRIVTIYRSFLAKKAREYQVGELDLRMALIATHDTVQSRQNLLVKTHAKDSHYE